MKKLFFPILILSAFFILTSSLYADDIRIVKIKRKVLLRDNSSSRWRTAKLGEVLSKDSELLTKRKSECTLSLTKDYKQIITIKEKSKVIIKDLIANTLKLEKGRVFALIEKIDKGESFQIKTPTAIAGVRGTGLEVNFARNITSALCHEGMIFIEGLDTTGNVVSQDELWPGFSVEITEDGDISDFVRIEEENREEWNNFKEDADQIIQINPLRDIQVIQTTTKSTKQGEDESVSSKTESSKKPTKLKKRKLKLDSDAALGKSKAKARGVISELPDFLDEPPEEPPPDEPPPDEPPPDESFSEEDNQTNWGGPPGGGGPGRPQLQ